jgi:hypothetical protein
MYVYRKAPDLSYTCDISEEAEALPIGREARHVGRTDIEVAFKAVLFSWHRYILMRRLIMLLLRRNILGSYMIKNNG